MHDHAPFGKPLGTGHGHVVLPDGLEQAGAGIANDRRGLGQTEHGGRQDHVLQRIDEVPWLADRVHARGRQPIEFEREDIDQDERQKERGNGDRQEAGNREQVVDDRILLQGRDDAERYPDDDRDHKHDQHQLERWPDPLADLLVDGQAVDGGITEVAAGRFLEPLHVAHRQGIVQAERFALLRNPIRTHVRHLLGIHEGGDRITRREVDDDVHRDGDAEQDRDTNEYAAKKKLSHELPVSFRVM